MIPYGRQNISQADIDAVIDVLKSDFLTQGPWVEKFEKRVAEYCGVTYAIAVSSATAGLHLAYLALGVGPGKKVWTVPNTFVATANAALYCGAKIDFVDIDPDTFAMSLEALENKLVQAKLTGELPDLVAPVHFSGQSVDMLAIHELADIYGFKVVEDAAHCIGASYNNKKIGSCQFSNATVFSFHPVKVITTGEGGLITTNDKNLYQVLLRLRTHGITRDPQQMSKNDGGWFFEQQDLGYHYRITDIQCALGYSQMDQLDHFVEKRNQLARRYDDKLKHTPVKPITVMGTNYSSWHLYALILDDRYNRRKVYDCMKERGVGVNVHYIPVHLQPYFSKLGFREGDFPISEHYYNQALTLPLYPGLSDAEQDYVCQTLFDCLNEENAGR